ncbi:MAG: hypothetical protein JETCAE03_33100 [Ignavibacteriaceae bacterium]|jgi:hypothetical protein|nr:MAG: hypothetical protein JETCAE03_33100 [Ignavibacteriaceae bacterium]
MNTRTRRVNTDFDEILESVCEKIEDGRPDFSNQSHISILIEVLKESNWPESAIKVLVRNLLLQNESVRIDEGEYDKLLKQKQELEFKMEEIVRKGGRVDLNDPLSVKYRSIVNQLKRMKKK